MREINDAGKIENEREPKRHERVERADDQPIESVVQKQLRHRQFPSGQSHG